MLRTLLIATTLLAASGSALAHSDYGYGRVVAVEPHIVFSFGSPHPDGFRVLVESGGARYWTHTSYRPGHMIMLPPPPYVRPVYYRDRGYRGDWDDHDAWREERREHRHEHRRHGRD